MRELEFLPADYLRSRFQRRVGFIRSWLLLVLGMAMVLWSVQMGARAQAERDELSALRSSGSAVEADVAKVRKLQQESWVYNRRIELLRALRPSVRVADAVAVVTDLVPADVVLDDLSLRPAEKPPAIACIRLAGVAPSERVVTNMLTSLEASPMLKQAVLLESKPLTHEEASRRSFVIEARVMAAARPGA